MVLSILSRICLVPVWTKRFISLKLSVHSLAVLQCGQLNWIPKDGLWSLGFQILQNYQEPCWVCVQAGHLLINLTSSPIYLHDSSLYLLSPSNMDDLVLSSQETTELSNTSTNSQSIFVRISDSVNEAGDKITSTLTESLDDDYLTGSYDVTDDLDTWHQELRQVGLSLRPWLSELFDQDQFEQSTSSRLSELTIGVRLTQPPRSLTLPTYLDRKTNVGNLDLQNYFLSIYLFG